MLILGIETTCDETGAAVVKDGREILSNVIASQTGTHKKYGGVVPEVAARMHLEALPFVVESALDEAKLKIEDIDGIAVATEVGLPPALVTGYSYAQGLAIANDKPLTKVNHLEAHVHANWLYDNTKGNLDLKEYKKIEYPHICLLVSGGHTEILLVSSPTEYKVIGRTHDDAAGEAFDKVARMLDLPYPGGLEIDKLAVNGDELAIDFPRPMMGSKDLDFSFSGLKTAVKVEIEEYMKSDLYKSELKPEIKEELLKNFKADVAASFQEAIVDVLIFKTIDAAHNLSIELITLAGGVAANSRLREMMDREAAKLGYDVRYPELFLCVDNAAMIAGRGYYDFKK